MDLQKYFNEHEGTGILATSDKNGNVDIALYATPHIIDDKTIAFIMRPRRSLQNIQSNPKAAYMFLENAAGYKGMRLYLKKQREEKDANFVNTFRTSRHGGDEASAVLVYFTVEETRPIVGDGE